MFIAALYMYQPQTGDEAHQRQIEWICAAQSETAKQRRQALLQAHTEHWMTKPDTEARKVHEPVRKNLKQNKTSKKRKEGLGSSDWWSLGRVSHGGDIWVTFGVLTTLGVWTGVVGTRIRTPCRGLCSAHLRSAHFSAGALSLSKSSIEKQEEMT